MNVIKSYNFIKNAIKNSKIKTNNLEEIRISLLRNILYTDFNTENLKKYLINNENKDIIILFLIKYSLLEKVLKNKDNVIVIDTEESDFYIHNFTSDSFCNFKLLLKKQEKLEYLFDYIDDNYFAKEILKPYNIYTPNENFKINIFLRKIETEIYSCHNIYYMDKRYSFFKKYFDYFITKYEKEICDKIDIIYKQIKTLKEYYG